MHIAAVRGALLGPFLLAGGNGSASSEGSIRSSRSPIAYGSADSSHTAVVSVLAPVGSDGFAECSGTVV